MMDLENLSRSNVNSRSKNLSCLEIGPSNTPTLLGNNVEYFDILTQQEIIDRDEIVKWELPNYGTPYINYVDKTGNLSIINKKYDIVFSSHCIEHQFSLIDHLNQVHDLLKTNSYYIIICPDKRYCFDHFFPETNVAKVIEDFYTKRKKHSLQSFIQTRMLATHNDLFRHWAGDHGDYKDYGNDNMYDFKELTKENIEKYQNESNFVDCHNYQFTPDSFRETISFLIKMEYINFEIVKVVETEFNTNEFLVVLKKNNRFCWR